MSELYRLSARAMVARLKNGDITPQQALDDAYARIEAVEPDIFAMPTLCRERAYAAAARIADDSASRAARRGDPTWLAGLPIAVKDLVDVAGVRTTYGSPIYANHIPEKSDIMVEHLEANGAVVLGKSNTPEFGAGGNSFNEVFPATRTPWDTRCTAGGSSGGAAAALASGEIWLATGSDLGGSLRTPASFCGIVGLRPSPGRIANGPNPLPFGTMSVEGPMARDVADTALFLDAMAGHHPQDPLSLDAPQIPFQSAIEQPPRARRAAFSRDLGTPVDPDVIDACERAVQKLTDAGWEITEDAPDFSTAMETFQILRAASFAAGMHELYENHRDQLKPEIIWNIEKGLNQSAETVGWATRERGIIYHRMVAFFESHDLLLSPSACTAPFPVEQRFLESLGDHSFETYMDWLALPSMITVTSCPALSLPCATTSAGLPVGLQMVGPPRGEDALLSAAHAAEQVLNMAETVPRDPETSWFL